MNWLRNVTMAVKAFIAVVPLVRVLIEAFEAPGFGEEKKERVLEAVGVALEKLGVTGKIKDLTIEFADWLIDAIVWTMNITGEFLHRGQDETSSVVSDSTLSGD